MKEGDSELIRRYLKGECTPLEAAKVEAWYNHLVGRRKTEIPEADYARYFIESLEVIYLAKRRARVARLVRWIPYAAAVIIGIATASWYFFNNSADNLSSNELAVHDMPPGTNRATLKLPDGTSIELDESHKGIITTDSSITYLGGTGSITDLTTAAVNVLTLVTPKGGTYELILPDGSKVWLNAESMIKYPSKFAQSERVVEVTGEVYFSVVKGEKQPFKVLIQDQLIEVLGTEFNITAYPEEEESRTTLVKGAISVLNRKSNAVNRLVPSQQAVTNGERTQIERVETSLFTAWKDGYFNFKSTPLEEVLRQAARWYDVKVVYLDGIPREVLGGQFKRDVSLLGLIEILQLSNINVTLEGNELIVK